MLGSFKPVPFDSSGRRRSGPRLPRWLVLLLVGIGVGAGGVIYVQQSHLPPRLSYAETTELRGTLATAEAERLRLDAELADNRKRLDAALAEAKTLGADLASTRSASAKLRTDLAAIVATLPPDPRGGSVEVRSAQFKAAGGSLAYDLVLTRGRGGDKPLPALMTLAVAGQGARGTETTVDLEPVVLSLDAQEIVRGSLRLPEGFKPRQTTVKILDRGAGRQLGMRIVRIE